MQWPFTQTFNVSLIYNTHQLTGLTFQNVCCPVGHSRGCVWLGERGGVLMASLEQGFQSFASWRDS